MLSPTDASQSSFNHRSALDLATTTVEAMETTLEDVSSLLFAEPLSCQQTTALVGPVEISTTGVVHGRGLRTTRKVLTGECLFVISPTVAAPWKEVARTAGTNKSLETVAETILLKQMKRALKSIQKQPAASFLFLTTGHDQQENLIHNDNSIQLCLGQTEPEQTWWQEAVSDDILKQLIRHNAFGPEFHNYVQMEDNLASFSQAYHRILGMYPLAAIINHSCHPNAVRVFSQETMIVHACSDIEEGQEILWSYIPPTQPLSIRQEQLKTKFGFDCQCHRCSAEKDLSTLISLEGTFSECNLPNLRIPLDVMEPRIHLLEETLTDSSLTNEIRHYIRTGYLNVYLNYLNAKLPQMASPREMMSIAMKLHLALSVVHNASTEHMSILHLCYDLSESPQRVLWTEQLKKAHMTRYGSLGNNVQNVRLAMQHTKGILRHLDGFQARKWGFL
jgi:hypothetical protein